MQFKGTAEAAELVNRKRTPVQLDNKESRALSEFLDRIPPLIVIYGEVTIQDTEDQKHLACLQGPCSGNGSNRV